MRLYKSAGRNQCSQFANILLLLSVMLLHFNCWPRPEERNVP